MSTLKAEMPAPMFTLNDVDGRSHVLADTLKNGPVLLAFFKISCPVCQFTFPFLQRIYQNYGDSKVSFWGISQDTPADTREFLNEFGVKFTSLIDTDGYKVSKQYGLTNVPSLFFIEPNGKIGKASVAFNRREIESIAAEMAKVSGKPAQPVFLPSEKIPDYRPG